MNSTIAQDVAAWLLTYALHSTALLGLAWLVLRLRRSDPAVRDVLWKVAMIGGVVTATVQSGFDVHPTGTVALAATPAPTVSDPTGAVADPVDPVPVRRERQTDPAGQSAREAGGVATTPSASAPSVGTILTLAWGVLALLLVTWYAGRRLILVGRLGDRRGVGDDEWRGLLASLSEEAGVRRRIHLTASQAISSPVALGRREICLPQAALDDLEPAQRRAMLAHELAHLVRRDPQWLSFSCVLERLFFFQPLNRLARRNIQESAEYLADEWAARRSGGVPLARCLVKVAEWIEASPLGVPVAGMAEQRSQLSARVTRLLERGDAPPAGNRLATVFSMGALLATVFYAPGVAGHLRYPDAFDPAGVPTDARLGLEPVGPEQPNDNGTGDLTRRWSTETATRTATNTNISRTFSNRVSRGTDGLTDQEREVALGMLDGKSVAGLKGDTAVVRALMARLRDDDADVRRAAAHALGRLEEPMAIPALVAALDDADRNVRSAALGALSNFERGVPAAPVRKMLAAEDPDTRQEAIQMLGEMKDRESLPAIARLVTDPDADVRQSAIQALSEIRDPSSASAVAAALGDADADVRQEAIQAMIELGGTIPEAQLTRLLGDPSADVRQEAACYVAERHVTAAVPAVIRLLDDTSSDVREQAAEALTELKTPESHAALKRALNHADAKVRRIAVDYFGDEGGQ